MQNGRLQDVYVETEMDEAESSEVAMNLCYKKEIYPIIRARDPV